MESLNPPPFMCVGVSRDDQLRLSSIQVSERMSIHLAAMSPNKYLDALLIMLDPHRRQMNESVRLLPCLDKGHCDDLKLEWTDAMYDGGPGRSEYRLWVSRMTKEDGAPSDHQIILEHRYGHPNWRHQWGWRQFPHS